MKTHTIKHAGDVDIHFEYIDNEMSELSQNDYEDIQGFIRGGHNGGEFHTDNGILKWKIK